MKRHLFLAIAFVALALPTVAQSRLDLDAFGGSPWTSADRMRAFMDQSPITYASRIRTPTLIMRNMRDYRVTPTHAFKLYLTLKSNSVETKFIGYPLPGHNAAEPVHQRDVQRRWMEWVAQHFGGTSTTSSQQ